MLLRWSCCVLLILLLVDIEKTHCKSYKSSSLSSGSRGSSSSGSRGSYGSGSSHNSGSASHGNYGWNVQTSRPITHTTPRRTTHRPITTLPTRRTTHRPITTLPTRRTTHHIITTLPTRRTTHHVITTLPTRKTTHHVITTLPTAKTTHTRQPPYNPNFTPAPKLNYTSGPNRGTTKQPPYNPFYPSSTSNHGTTKQPPYNPFFSSSASNLGITKKTTPNPFLTTSSHKNNSSIYTKQPPFNPNFTPAPAVTPKYNGTNSNIWGQTTPHPNPRPSNNGSIWGNTPKPYHNNSIGVITPKPPTLQTTKIIPVGGGNNGRKNNTWPTQPSRPNNKNYTLGVTQKHPTYATPKPIYVGPSYNTSINQGNGRPGVSGGIYQPPIRRNNTFTTGSAIHPVQPVIHPTQGHPSTTIINNNNHYYGGSGYYQPGHYTPPGAGPTHVTIINNNNYNTNHHVIVPSRNYYSYGPPAIGISVNTNYYDHFPVRYHTTYHYSSYDTGSSALGFFLGYELGRITRPSYYYHSTSYVNNEYIPRYDHYTVHHYYHNSASIPKESPIQPNAVVVCAGDSGILCPPGTMPLCTNNGAVMCVVNSVTAKPCNDNKQLNCFTSTISCEGNPSAECKQKSSASVSMPCVSTASIPAGVSFVNNSVIVTDTNDSTVKSFCVTVLALPTKNETNSTNSQQSQVDIYVPYRYTTNDTGVDILGYYLGYKLQNLVEPSYSYLNYDQNYNYIDKFNHYNVFHYYHDANVLSKDVDIKKEQIMNCAGDSGTFCPQFTVSLCLNDGAVFCAADLSSTTFNDQLQTNYINSSVSCDQLQSPVCLSNPNQTIPIQIPCISTAKIYADISYMIRNYGTGNNTQYYRTAEVSNVTSAVENSTVQRELCVTILALPGEKITTEIPTKRKVTGVPNDTGYLSLPKYTYTTNDTGTSIFGAYLIYRLGKLKFPTYYFMNAFLYAQNAVIQKYDHYSVHYHARGKEIVPDFLEFQAFDLRACEGDSGLICPANTSVICLNDGAVMCLTDLLATVPCIKSNNTVCARTTVTCEKNNPCIKGGTKKVLLPCISTATIYGDIMSVNNNIYKNSPAAARVYTDIQPIPGTNVNSTPVYHKAQQFCVSLVTLPAERTISEGEKLADNSDAVFGKILSGLFGNW